MNKRYVIQALIEGEFTPVYTAARVDVAKKRLRKAEGMLQTKCRIVDAATGLKIEERKTIVYSMGGES